MYHITFMQFQILWLEHNFDFGHFGQHNVKYKVLYILPCTVQTLLSCNFKSFGLSIIWIFGHLGQHNVRYQILYILPCKVHTLFQITYCFKSQNVWPFWLRMTRACIILFSMQFQIFWLKDYLFVGDFGSITIISYQWILDTDLA